MILHFNVKGEARKAMVRAVEKETGIQARYMGVPSCAYTAGDYTVGRNGELSFPDGTPPGDSSAVIDACVMATGITPEEWEQNTGGPEETPETADTALTVAIPEDTMTEEAIANLEKLVEAKAGLIRSAFGAGEVKVIRQDGKLLFPWFENADPGSTDAFLLFVTRLCDLARNAKRVTAKEKEVGNEKYAFRCFLLRLGFIGPEYKGARKALMKNLTGSSAFRDGRKGESDDVSE